MFCTGQKEEHDRLEYLRELVVRESNEYESLGSSTSNVLLETFAEP